MPVGPHYRAEPAFAALPALYDEVAPARFPRHQVRFRNRAWSARVGLASLTDTEWEDHFARFVPLPDNLPTPLALRYHGHQFMSYNPALGDGRGFLFAQLRDGCDGRLLDLGTKGSGTTPYSRGGDGRLTLKGGVREVLATEMLEARGVNTSKTFSLFETFERLERYDEPSPTRSAVLVRLSHSHVRIGTFQRLAYHRDTAALYALLEHCAQHLFPDVARDDGALERFVRTVSRLVATTCAAWMAAGFVHGVLNSDNVNVTGESFDYGPYRFLPHFDATFTAAYFDHGGLYAYGRQPQAMRWNLGELAKSLRAIASDTTLEAAISVFDEEIATALGAALARRLGLSPRGAPFDDDLVRATFDYLEASQVPFDPFFHDWYGGERSATRALEGPRRAFYDGAPFHRLRAIWGGYATARPERLEHPYFQRDDPCDLVIDELETIWSAIAEHDDWSPLEHKLSSIRERAHAHGNAMVPPREPAPMEQLARAHPHAPPNA